MRTAPLALIAFLFACGEPPQVFRDPAYMQGAWSAEWPFGPTTAPVRVSFVFDIAPGAAPLHVTGTYSLSPVTGVKCSGTLDGAAEKNGLTLHMVPTDKTEAWRVECADLGLTISTPPQVLMAPITGSAVTSSGAPLGGAMLFKKI